MSKEDDSLESLDSEFDHFLVDMKPYVLRRPHKSERQRCALWIKKLCDPVASGSGLRGRKNRNVYARLLLQMLRRGVLEGPFAHKPEAGTLKTLPTYMSIYFDEPLGARGLGPTTLPDWVSGELAYEDEMWSSLAKDSSSLLNAQRYDIYYQYRNSHCKCCYSSLSSQIEMRTKVLEAKHQEEKLKLQQRHDADVQKILERKNGEIEELKSLHRTKQKEADEVVRALQKKVQSLLRESQVIRQSKEEQIAELKKMADQSADSLKNDWEKKLHAAVTQMEQEKFELQKKHTDNIQELLEDTTQRLAKMEAEYRAQLQATEQTVRELETRVKQLSVEVENGNLLRQKVTQEKAELEIHIAAISAELQEANRRNTSLQRENSVQREQHEEALQKLEVKHDADISHFHQEHALSAVKASEVIEDLERLVSQLKLQLKDSEHRRQKQIRVSKHHAWVYASRLYNTGSTTFALLSACYRLLDPMEREEQLSRLRDSQRQQMLQAESALDSFKKQLEISSEKAYADLKQQIVELKLQYEQERSHLFQQHNAEKDSLVQDHQREIGSLQQQTRAAMLQHQAQTQEWRKRDAQSISELEAQVQSLREEVLAAHSQRKQQLAELGVLREEERQQAAREQEAALDRLRTEMERARLDLEKIHAAERDLAQEKANSRLKQLEKEYSQKLAKSAQAMTELQTALCSVKEESKQRQQAQQRQLEETQAHWDEERRQLSRDAERASKALQERVEALQRQLHAAEKLLLSRDLEFQEQITRIRQQYEMKIKGLMPVELRQELEDTITSLKSQARNTHTLKHITAMWMHTSAHRLHSLLSPQNSKSCKSLQQAETYVL
uniref:DUF4485 domain-containing protein n=1 Tax=Electrophorus electricus TaxID=8005 RepID=A0A4W4DQE1_ELEEL